MGPTARQERPRSEVSGVFAQTTSPRRVTFLLYVFTLAAFVTMAAGGKPQHRYKRNLYQMCSLMNRHTGRNCLDYNNYGCFCGLGTPVATPVDTVDSCCRSHDICYDGLKTKSCTSQPQFVTYDTSCDSGGCRCTDSPTSAACKYNTCQCDLRFAQCLKTAGYNSQYKGWDRKSKCKR